MGRRGSLFVDDIAEEFCFACKDGGAVRVCDFKNCLKAYHPRCLGKEEDFLSSDEQFICDWHSCVNCKRKSDYQCFCCPFFSTCDDCVGIIEFVKVKQSKGFCEICLEMAIMVEKDADADFDEARIDFRGMENYVLLFKDYWEIIKDKEGFTLLQLQKFSILLKRSLNCKEVRGSEKLLDEDHEADGNLSGDNDDAEQTVLYDTKGKQNEVQAPLKRKRSNKKTYVGWGSEELIEFLSCIGKDTTEPLDQFGLVGVVKDYIQQKNLFQDKKKKTVMCDDKLRSVFRKRKLKYNMIYSLLETHLAANAASEDESIDGYEDDSGSILKKNRRNSMEPTIPKRVSERNKRCFASLNQNNLKLIYLKKSLVVNLLSRPDTFEQKVVGCLVRVKNDLKGYNYQMSKKLYQIGLVTGIKKSSEEYKIKDSYTDILLCVSNMWDEVKISMLSEEDFEEDECNDLLLLVKKGHFKRPTVAELQQKVASVHADIVNHSIDKELLRLEKEIERANQKGWRKELNDLRHQKELLSTPVERQRRLEEVPEVIPDTEEETKDSEFEAAASNLSQGNRGSKRDITACLKDEEEKSKGATEQLANSLEVVVEESPEGATEQVADSLKVVLKESLEGTTGKVADPLKVVVEESPEGASDRGDATCEVASQGASERGDTTCEVASEAASKALCNGGTSGPGLRNQMRTAQVHANGGTTRAIDMDNGKDEDGPRNHNGGDIVMVDLDPDENQDLHPGQNEPEHLARRAPEAMNGITVPTSLAPEVVNGITVHTGHGPEAMNGIAVRRRRASKAKNGVAINKITEGMAMWNYIDPQGEARGPFPMNLMRQWQQNGFFPVDFRVWRIGQTMDKAILLTDAMRLTF